MHLILHVGQPKTGTTSIQFCLKAHSARFRRHGIFVPTTGQDEAGSHLPLILALKSEDPCAVIAELRSELARHAGLRALISSEYMYTNISLGRFGRILDRLWEAGAKRFTIVMYLRSPFQQMNSLYAQMTATFAMHGLDIAGFVERLNSPKHKGLRAFFEYERVIEIARRDDVDLVLKPYNGAVAKSVYADFLKTIGVPPPDSAREPRINGSFGPASLEAMRVVASELGKLSEPQWRPLRAFANRFAIDHPEKASYWGIDEAIATNLSHLDEQTERLAQFAWGKPWREVVGDERRPLTVFKPGVANAEQTRIYEAMLSGLRSVALHRPSP